MPKKKNIIIMIIKNKIFDISIREESAWLGQKGIGRVSSKEPFIKANIKSTSVSNEPLSKTISSLQGAQNAFEIAFFPFCTKQQNNKRKKILR